MRSLVAMKEMLNRPDSAKCGSKGVAFEHRLFRVRVCYFYCSPRRLLADHAEPQCSRIRRGICASVTGVAAKVVEGLETARGETNTILAMNAWLRSKVSARQGCTGNERQVLAKCVAAWIARALYLS